MIRYNSREAKNRFVLNEACYETTAFSYITITLGMNDKKSDGGGGVGVGQKSKKKNFPRKSLIKTIYSYGFGQKKYAQGGSVQVRLLQINYAVNDKSRLEIKRDFLKSQHDS